MAPNLKSWARRLCLASASSCTHPHPLCPLLFMAAKATLTSICTMQTDSRIMIGMSRKGCNYCRLLMRFRAPLCRNRHRDINIDVCSLPATTSWLMPCKVLRPALPVPPKSAARFACACPHSNFTSETKASAQRAMRVPPPVPVPVPAAAARPSPLPVLARRRRASAVAPPSISIAAGPVLPSPPHATSTGRGPEFVSDNHVVPGALAPRALQLQAATEVDAARALLARFDRLLAQLQAVPNAA